MICKLLCVLSNNPNFTAIPIDIDVSLTVGDLKEAVLAKKINDLPDLDADKLTLVRICKVDVGGLTKVELKRSTDPLSLKAYGEDPEDGGDAVSALQSTPGSCWTKDGLFFKVMNSLKKISFYSESLPEELYHVRIFFQLQQTQHSTVSLTPEAKRAKYLSDMRGDSVSGTLCLDSDDDAAAKSLTQYLALGKLLENDLCVAKVIAWLNEVRNAKVHDSRGIPFAFLEGSSGMGKTQTAFALISKFQSLKLPVIYLLFNKATESFQSIY
ncbi:hypothetical protein HK100_010318, partial [Physocladia obscura]